MKPWECKWYKDKVKRPLLLPMYISRLKWGPRYQDLTISSNMGQRWLCICGFNSGDVDLICDDVALIVDEVAFFGEVLWLYGSNANTHANTLLVASRREFVSVVWVYRVDTDDFMTPLLEGWSIWSTVGALL
ncbi:hypothetical protein Tco_1031151 [Tanacetum coccineum]|uniref:Uncharacterized protein n=1 Tax=Tanacetum coccineum TaxID=301880 RepID=A0ABQ5G9N9_9ASTR